MTNNAILPITVSDSSTNRTKQIIKIWSIIILIVQNSALVLMMRYSRTTKGPMYSATSCVFFMEFVKVLMSLFFVWYQKEFAVVPFIRTIYTSLMGSPVDTLKMLIPATIYAIQNNLLFIALSNLSAASYQVTYQLKILTTAMFSVTMLGKNLFKHQWFALLLLMVGVTLVQLDLQSHAKPARQPQESNPEIKDDQIKQDESDESNPSDPRPAPAPGARGVRSVVPNYEFDDVATEKPSPIGRSLQSVDEDKRVESPVKGLVAVLLACFSSGFAGVYFEKVVKSAESSIWIRNIQLGIFGMLFSFIAMILQDGASIYEHGIFYGYNWLVFGVVLMQAAGGLLVAIVVKYADNILKGFATSVSIVLSAVVEFFISGNLPSVQFMGGTMVVLFSVYLYSLPQR